MVLFASNFLFFVLTVLVKIWTMCVHNIHSFEMKKQWLLFKAQQSGDNNPTAIQQVKTDALSKCV